MSKYDGNYVFVIEGVEHFGEVKQHHSILNENPVRRKAEDFVRGSGLTAPRGSGKTTSVKTYKQVISGNEIKREFHAIYECRLPEAAMTKEEFDREQAAILADIPEEFHSALITKAWDEGHSSGFEECILTLENLVYIFREPINKYRDRLLADTRKAPVKKGKK